MKTKVLVGMLIAIVLLVGIAMAHEDFSITKKLIDSNISCNELSEGQLEEMGDYYMEQMHPGEAHEMMHDMMGGHDSETTKLMHINMAKGIYCDEDVDMMGSGMMGMMQGRGMMGSGDMMSSGMMKGMMGQGNMMESGMMGGQMQTNMMTGNAIQGMMGNWQYGYGYWNFVNVLYTILLIGLIILVSLGIKKLWRR